MRVLALDQVDFPGTDIMLERLLALDRLVDVRELLVPDEPVNLVFLCELGADACAMFMDTLDQAVRDTDVHCAMRLAGEHVDPIGAYGRTSQRKQTVEYAARWVLGTSPRMTPVERPQAR